MARPGKAAAAIDNSVSHRTKAELEQRKQAEQALLSGSKLFERSSVVNDKTAHREFLRVSKLLEKIGKSNALYGAVCNRYCELYSEVRKLTERTAELNEIIDRLNGKIDEIDSADDLTNFTKQIALLVRQVNSVDALIMQKRKMMFDIEKENCMTVASSIRTIPKAAEKKQENPLLAILSGDEEESSNDDA